MLYREVAGEGPAVALLHSTVCDSRMWDAEFAALTERYRVLRYDFRGFGCSPLPPEPWSSVDDLRGLLDEAGMERVALVGLSGGAATALDFALAEPERVRGLVLAAPAIGGLDWSEEVQRFGAEEDALLDAGDLDAAVELNLRMWVDGPRRDPEAVDPGVRARVGEMQRRAFEVQLASEPGEHRRLRPPAVERLEEVAAPTLVLVGDADVPDVLRNAELLESRVPGARKVVVPGVAHMVNLERPGDFLRLVRGFLDGL
ncbi:MAG: alpha/beta fold hydrolase [Gaiellaceae bacterium]